MVLETLQSERKPAQICRREGVMPNLVYQWRKQLLASAPHPAGRGDPTRRYRTCGRWTIIVETRRRCRPSVGGNYKRPGNCVRRRTSSCDNDVCPGRRPKPSLIRQRRVSHFD
ncbi:MAG: transposase [Phycisphaerae bacterium]|nr:transposase [Phycisphaerae bacterium]